MNERSSLNQIHNISKDTRLSTKLDVELLILDLLKIDKNILYGTVFLYKNKLDVKAARKIEQRSKKLWKLTKNLHRYFQRILARILI